MRKLSKLLLASFGLTIFILSGAKIYLNYQNGVYIFSNDFWSGGFKVLEINNYHMVLIYLGSIFFIMLMTFLFSRIKSKANKNKKFLF